MNKIDKRTGKTFPSVVRRDAIDLLRQLSDSRSHGQASNLEGQEATERHMDDSRNWTLTLDPQSMTDFGAFEDYWPYEGQVELERSEHGPRPLEWFQRAARVIHDRMEADEALWQAINDIFDQAIEIADKELGFADEEV